MPNQILTGDQKTDASIREIYRVISGLRSELNAKIEKSTTIKNILVEGVIPTDPSIKLIWSDGTLKVQVYEGGGWKTCIEGTYL
jgi:hypothetical protein